MNEIIPVHTFFGFLFAMARTSAWMAISPPFNTRIIPRLVKVGAAAAISCALAPGLPTTNVSFDTGPLIGEMAMQVATGLILGYLTLLLFAAAQTAGQMIDIFSGFTMSTAMDPLLNNQSSVFGRFYELMATTLLFIMNGHLLLIKGFLTSFNAIPLDSTHIDGLKQLLFRDIGMLFLAAVEIAGPLLAAFFLAEIALGLLSKAAPQLNIFTFGFPFKILMTVLIVASAVPLLPGALHTIINHVFREGVPAMNAGAQPGG